MNEVDPSLCDVHVLICTNRRETDEMPACGGIGDDLLKWFRIWIRKHGLIGRVWVTETKCLGWCHEGGGTVFVYPDRAYYRAVTLQDCETIAERHLGDLVG